MDWMVQHLPAEIQTKLMIHFKASDLDAFLFFMLLFLVLDYRHGFDALPVSRIKAF
jgi:hypothetical protein